MIKILNEHISLLGKWLVILLQYGFIPIVAVYLYGISTYAIILFLFMHILIAAGVTVGYHRYFSHRSFKTSRVFQFVLALIASLAIQRGILWWAAHHRNHHRYTDDFLDPHSPARHGFHQAHLGWMWKYIDFDAKAVGDLMKYPELRWINKYFFVVPMVVIGLLFVIGNWVSVNVNTNLSGGQFVTWGYVIPVFVCLHGSSAINSICHYWGYKTFDTPDNSRNNIFIAVLMLGEGWHNNHHRYPQFATMQNLPHEFDAGFAIISLLEKIGLVWDVRKKPMVDNHA